MKTITLIGLLTLFSFGDTVETNVFICKSEGSERYHLERKCRGLKPCEAVIEEVSKEKARSLGRTLCKWED